MITKKQIETFLIERKGYLKKSGIETAKAIWKNSSKHSLPKNQKELQKELDLIKEVQTNLRKAISIETEVFDNGLIDIYQKIIDEKNRPKKVLLFDIEVSGNLVHTWRVGYKINIPVEAIIKERAVICLAYKWLGEEKTYSLKWDNGDDKEMLKAFSKIIESADEVITQNGDRFDVKWLRTRCLYHRIQFPQKLNSLDTLKFAKSGFYFNSNKLDYMGKFLGVGQKIHTPPDLWIKILMNNDKKAMSDMIEYCKGDIKLLEDVYNELQPYVAKKKFRYKI